MKKVYLLLCAAFLCLVLSGCTGRVASTDLAIVTLNGQNMPALQGDEDAVRSYIEAACAADTGSTVSVIIADGTPYQAGFLSFNEKESKNGHFWAQEQAQRVESAVQLLTSTAATPETNPLDAIRLAARSLQSGTAEQKVLVVAHSGISTTGALSMQNLDLAALDQLLGQLSEQGYIADLQGVDVHWLYLGDTDGAQPDLSPAQVQQLRDFWQSYLQEVCGAQSVTFHEDLPAHTANSAAPAVSVLAPQTTVLTTPVALDSDQLGFAPDQWQLSDPDQAAAQLAPLAQALCASPDTRCILAGSTADTAGSTLETSQRFSLQRAQQVQQVLCDLGVPADQLTALGLGNVSTSVRSTDPAANRVVWIVPTNNPLAEEFLSVGLAG